MSKKIMEEKRRIDEAVAKVREVVDNVSKNDIILALHQFDLDVNRTIQAFCEEGAQSTLDSWERTGQTTNKKRTQKKKKKASSSATTAAAAPVPVAEPIPKVPAAVPAGAQAQVSINGHLEYANGASSTIFNGEQKLLPKMDSLSISVTATDKQGQISKTTIPNNNNSFSGIYQKNIADGELSAEMSTLKNCANEIDKIETSFENELDLAEQNVRHAFKEIRQLLADRESYLLAELKRLSDDGSRILMDYRSKSMELNERLQRQCVMNDVERMDLIEEFNDFIQQFQYFNNNIAYQSRFIHNTQPITQLIRNFGQVVGIKNTLTSGTLRMSNAQQQQQQQQQAVKHSGSHSSLASSFGEDSGLGHISPVSNEKQQVAEISNGGIHMKSDALSADELADLNRKLQETLKAQGIDASILRGIGASGDAGSGGSGTMKSRMPARRRPFTAQRPNTFNNSNNSKAVNSSNSKGNTTTTASTFKKNTSNSSNGIRRKVAPQPQLSILQS